MPAEWEPHAATWLAWPHEESDWPGKLAAIPWVYTEIIRHLHRYEHVHLLVNDSNKSAAREALTKAGDELVTEPEIKLAFEQATPAVARDARAVLARYGVRP